MSIQATTLRPGLLVSLSTRVVGNVSYRKNVIEPEHITAEGTQQARWETERTVTDPEEHETSKKVRGKCRSMITGTCAKSAFGLLCPLDKQENLERAIVDARRLAEQFNETAQIARIEIYAITGRIAQDDVEAVRAISSEVRDLLDAMADGVRNLEPQAIRDAANAARNLGTMLTPAASERIQVAIDTARRVARDIVKAGEQASIEVDVLAIAKITEARTSFLDIGDAVDIATPEAEARAVDLAPESDPERDPEAEHAEYVAGQLAEEKPELDFSAMLDENGVLKMDALPAATPRTLELE